VPDEGIRCQVNAAVGRERDFVINTTSKKKKVVVVGGGPAGLEAARIARLRGHEVILIEKQSRLGGQLLLASVPPHKSTISDFTDYLIRQLKKLDVEIQLQTQATKDLLECIKPDVVLMATGVVPFTPPIPGFDTASFAMANEVLEGKDVGKNVIIIGGESLGCEVAEYLAIKDKNVTICEVAEYISESGKLVKREIFAESTPISLRGRLLERLSKLGVTMIGGVKYQKLTDNSLTIKTSDGKQKILKADTIILAAGARPNIGLYNQIKNRFDTFLIGDCIQPGRIANAIADANRIAYSI